MSARRSHVGQRFLLFLAVGVATTTSAAIAQQSSQPASASTSAAPYVPTLTFDVATIRETKPTDPMIVSFADPPHSSTFHFTNVQGWQLVTAAYGIDDYQLTRPPDWLKNTLYEVNAKSDPSVDDRLAKLSTADAHLEKQHMLQMLLADRFHLKVHWETRELPTLALEVAKKGVLQEARDTPPTPEDLKRFGDKPIPKLYQRGNGHPGYEFVAHGIEITGLISILSGNIDKDVLDHTGLTGKYDFILRYSGSRRTNKGDDPQEWPPLEDAIQDQLGLKVEPTKGPVQVLVIDSIEKPSEN